MANSPLLFIACVVSVLLCTGGGATVRRFKWEVGYIYASPDCEEKLVMAINGQFPGPTIRAKAGDTIHLQLKNTLHTEGVVIHWHGIRQHGTPWADGTASISQCAINPEESFLYRFKVDKAGTYFYHGHYGMQRAAGLYGSLIVDVADGEEEPFQYDGEFNLLLSDWYHTNIYDQMVGLSSRPMKWIGEPQVSDELNFFQQSKAVGTKEAAINTMAAREVKGHFKTKTNSKILTKHINFVLKKSI